MAKSCTFHLKLSCYYQPFPVCLFLLPRLPIDAVIHMDFRFDVTHKRQELGEDHLPVLLEVLLDDTHLLLGLFLNFSGAAAMRSKCRCFLGLELFLPLQAVLLNLCLGFFFGLLQPSILSMQQASASERFSGRVDALDNCRSGLAHVSVQPL